MNTLIRLALDNMRMAISTLVLILVVGTVSLITINKEMNPDIPFPFISVVVPHDGISPEDAERLLGRPLEVRLRSIEGIKEMTTIGKEGFAQVLLEFDAGFDADKALLDVREEVNRAKSELPTESEEPIVQEFNASQQPVLTIILFGEAPERVLTRVAQNLKDEIESLPGVLEANIRGRREEMLEIVIDPTKLSSYNISPSELINNIRNNNRLVAAGSLNSPEGSFSVKIPGLIENLEDVMGLPVKTSRDGIITIADLTDVRRTFKDATGYARMDGNRALTIDVAKRSGYNTVTTAAYVKGVLEAAKEIIPQNVKIDIIADESEQVDNFMGTLRNSVTSAIVLVAIIVVGALGLRSASLVGISIPGSFLFGILLLSAMGLSINMVVMFGLILSVGLLVDGAIVVSEYADRKMIEGYPRKKAYLLAGQRMAWPITASTLTTLAAFMPLLFWPGIMGEFMKYLPLTLIFTLAGSLVMALIFLPTLGALYGKPGEADPNILSSLAADAKLDVDGMSGLTGAYVRFLKKVVTRPALVLAAAFAILFGIWGVYFVAGNGTVLFPAGGASSIAVQIHARGNLSTDDKERLVMRVEERIKDVQGVDNLYSRVGDGASGGSNPAPDIIGSVRILMPDWSERPAWQEMVEEIRARTSDLPGIRVEPVVIQDGPRGQGKDVQVRLSSNDQDLLFDSIDRIRGHIEESMPGLVDVEDSRPLPAIQWELEIDRAEIGRFGTDTLTVGSLAQLVTNGVKVDEYRPDDADDEVDIRVRFPLQDRGIDKLDDILVQTPKGQVPITNLVTRVPKPDVSEIRRVDMERSYSVGANAASGVRIEAMVAELKAWIASEEFDPALSIRFAGQDETQQESTVFLIQAFVAALFMMAIILIAQFNSFYHAFLILVAVLLSTIGVMFGLLVTGRPFVILMTGVGVISLAGIVVNNNIVLIDTFARLVKEGTEPIDAILRTGAQRLRPVLLTTSTTIIGLLPMAMQFNIDFVNRLVEVGSPDAIFWIDLAIAVIFGLAVATLLTLIVTPAFLALRVNLRKGREERREARRDFKPSWRIDRASKGAPAE